MQYTVEDLAPLQKKIAVSIPAAEVDSAIDTVVKRYRTSVTIPGFRKGKVPYKMVEQQYQQSIYMETTAGMMDKNVNDIIIELNLEPVTKVDYTGEIGITRGQDFAYSFSFYHAPEFDLPAYEGFKVEQDTPDVKDSEVDAVLDDLRKQMASPVSVPEPRKPQDGDLVLMDFEGTDEDGEPVPGMKAQNMQVVVGEKKAMEGFEELLKTIVVGEEGQDYITFPENFPDPKLAGKKVLVKMKVTALFELRLPELDDEFASHLGAQFDSLEMLRAQIKNDMLRQRGTDAVTAAQERLLDELLKMVDFPLPEGMINRYTKFIVADVTERMEQAKQNFSSLGRTAEELEADAHGEAERFCRKQLFATRVAQMHGIRVTDGEMDNHINMMARQMKREYEDLRREYENKDLLLPLRDRLIFDKAMKFLYAKADVQMKPVPVSEIEKEDSAE